MDWSRRQRMRFLGRFELWERIWESPEYTAKTWACVQYEHWTHYYPVEVLQSQILYNKLSMEPAVEHWGRSNKFNNQGVKGLM